ncbi:MAG: alpha/beta fold hydrolase [Pseudomonadota bacterium]
MRKKLMWAWWLLVFALPSHAGQYGMSSEPLSFEVDGLTLSGVYSWPDDGTARGLVILVHGYGATNVVAQNGYFEFRVRLARAGFASFVWDKPGCGESDGKFDANQPVESSAREVTAAAAFLREREVAGSGVIGLWGISRAGWIAPLALAADDDLAFWISVSGVDDQENFGYLLESNWRIEGYNEETIDRLLAQWYWGNAVENRDATYEEYSEAMADYYADPFVQFVSGVERAPTREAFLAYRSSIQDDPPTVDPETGLQVYVDEFEQLLSSINVPVLALFGEKDRNVDWRKTAELYRMTMGKKPDAALTVRSFPDGNHNLHVSETGGFREMMALERPQRVPGYFESILAWLDGVVLD